MKSKFLIGTAALLSAGAIAWAAKDPVVLIINGEEVPKSEFEYLYRKNSQQQLESQPLEEYVGMFELYKMKVLDAKSEGIDTTASFRNEMAQYRRDLANPYIADSLYINSLVDEAYAHSREELEYKHIMLPKGRNVQENARNTQLADSIVRALKDGADFGTLARQYSTDRSKDSNGGTLGFIASGNLPYGFEHAAYNLKPGEISEVVESPAGYHIIMGGQRRPARGAVRAAHILKRLAPNASPEEQARVKQQIDSIYQVLLVSPENFEKVAMSESEDPGSARMGGQLGWFVTGQMIPEFSDVAFELPANSISEPVKTTFGWHIIKKLDARGPQTREEMKPQLLQRMSDPRDDRFYLIRDNRDANLAKKHSAKRNEGLISKMKAEVGQNGLGDGFYSTYGNSNEYIYIIDGKSTPVSEFVASMENIVQADPYNAGKILDEKLKNGYDEALITAEEDWLYSNVDDYRNLLNEYRDGSLLYEVSLRKVWDKAANDTKGLEEYFQAHKAEYPFKEPRVKGFLVLAKNDSVADLIKARFPQLDRDSALQVLRAEFRNDAVIDRLLAPQGLNRFVDKVMFNGPEPELNPKYPVYFILEGRIIEEPEEMNDVKGPVTTDYQQLLEQNWTTELKGKYSVVRNEKELKKIKP